MSIQRILLCILVGAVCTFLMRALPFLLLGGKREIPKKVKYRGSILPPALMAVLIVYCLRGVPADLAGSGIREIAASVVCAGLHIWKRNTFLSIIAGTLFYMILCMI